MQKGLILLATDASTTTEALHPDTSHISLLTDNLPYCNISDSMSIRNKFSGKEEVDSVDQGDESGPLSDDPVLEYTVVIARGFLQDSNGEIHSTITPKVVILLPQPKKTSYSGVEIDKIAKLSRFSDWLKDSCKPKNQDPSFTSHMQIFTSQSVFDDYFNNSLRIAKASLGTADSPETRKTAESAARRDIEFKIARWYMDSVVDPKVRSIKANDDFAHCKTIEGQLSRENMESLQRQMEGFPVPSARSAEEPGEEQSK